MVDNKYTENAYDTLNNLVCTRNEEGRVTAYTFNATNQRTSVTKGLVGKWCNSYVTTAETRTTSFQYLTPNLDIPTVITSPSVSSGRSKQTVLTYGDARFPTLPTLITQSGFTPAGVAVSRSVALTYDTRGQVTLINGPRTDVGDFTTLTYYDCTTGGACGQLKSVTNALGHVTTYDQYDAAGRLTQSTDPNGVLSQFGYDARGRMSFVVRRQGALVSYITYGYTSAGDLAATYFYPQNLTLTYTYDAARNLREVKDTLGNKVAYSYDTRGNRVSETQFNPDGSIATHATRAYDLRNRVKEAYAWRSASTVSLTQTIYDALGNLTQETAPNQASQSTGPHTRHQQDALNRLLETVDTLGGKTQYAYDVADRVTRVTTPHQATTTYVYDDLGNLLGEASADRGPTTYVHDAAGNLIRHTDALGQVTAYAYDALNRVTRIDRPGSEDDVTYTYDVGTSCSFGRGRLCGVVDEAGTETYAYDPFGAVTRTTRTQFNVSSVTEFRYDAAGRQTGLTYPGGRSVAYTRDALGRATQITTTVNGQSVVVSTDRRFRADGLLLSQRFGNGLSEARGYDWQGSLVTHRLVGAAGTTTRSYRYDLNGNTTQAPQAAGTTILGYDALNRLMTQSVPALAITYDGNGNRTSHTGQSYGLAPNTNRLTQVNGQAVQTDAAGNITQLDNRRFTFTARHQIRFAYQNNQFVGYYRYAHTSLRLQAYTATQGWTVFHYDTAGRLLQETDPQGNLRVAYLWADAQPLAQISKDPQTQQETLIYLHTDHLATPRLATDAQQRTVWRWEGEAFGATLPQDDPDGDGKKITVNLRFPGQYYDGETGLHYNWMRYYDPRIGRYITSDPIGLSGGPNTYAYVGNNPLRFTDHDGLQHASTSGKGEYNPNDPNCEQQCFTAEFGKCLITAGISCGALCAWATTTGPGALACGVGCSCNLAYGCYKVSELFCLGACGK